MRNSISTRAVRDIVRLSYGGLDSTTLRLEAIRHLRRAVPIDSFWFATSDPATLLFTGSVVEEIPEDVTPAFIVNEFLQDDVNKWVDLARSDSPVNSLYSATGGKPDTSIRYREILAPLGFGDELRAALLDGGSCWGFICLHREQSTSGFSSEDAGLLKRVTKHLAEGLRTALLFENLESAPVQNGPGLVLLSSELRLIGMNEAAERWLPDLADWHKDARIPQAIYAVAARLGTAEVDIVEGREELLPRVRVRTRSGRWLLLHASRLSIGDQSNQIAVILEAAPSWEVAPLILKAYGLTDREGEVAQLVLKGRSTQEIGSQLFISPLTVQQHLKSIFSKTGVTSRRQLTAQIFSEQYLPRILAGDRPGLNGSFR
jgi:DNA-binding CsgD family transcriptional regulator